MPDRVLKWLLLLPAAVLVFGTTIWPLVSAFRTSLHDWQLTRSPRIGEFVGLENYAFALTEDPALWRSLGITAVFVVLSVMLTVTLSLGLALLLRRAGVLERIVRAVLLLPFAMSPALIGVSWRFMANSELGVAHAALGWVVPPLARVDWLADPWGAMLWVVSSDVWHWTPYMTLVVLGGLAAIPVETEEAARVDGGGEWQVLRDVLLPQLMPVLGVVAILKTIFALKVFDQIYIITGGGPGSATETLAFLVWKMSFVAYDMGYAAALAWLLTALLVAVALPYMRAILRKEG
jgi:multiple sugar transport system permease protein